MGRTDWDRTVIRIIVNGMSETFVLRSSVAFADVDRDNVLTLQGVFKLLQEAAIAHANLYDTGTDAMLTRGESWVLKRMAVAIDRYPRFGEELCVETWSTGIRGSVGNRDFRIAAGDGQTIVRASSFWLYISVRAKAVVRVPAEIAERFPSKPGEAFCPDLQALVFDAPDPKTAAPMPMSLRYSDVDANGHVNNTVYFDLLQTALARLGRPARPRHVRIKYGGGIPGDTETVEVRLASAGGGGSLFSMAFDEEVFAQGFCE
jgi:acyl-ACP thioesterase